MGGVLEGGGVMALNWDTRNVKDWEKKTGALADMMIWLTMFVGINEITEKNSSEFFRRVSFLEKINGAFLSYNKKPKPITLEDVRSFIGLSTNASSITWSQFVRKQTHDWKAV